MTVLRRRAQIVLSHKYPPAPQKYTYVYTQGLCFPPSLTKYNRDWRGAGSGKERGGGRKEGWQLKFEAQVKSASIVRRTQSRTPAIGMAPHTQGELSKLSPT